MGFGSGRGVRSASRLTDGSRIDDCQLVSAGRNGAATLWLFTNGADRFVALAEVTAVWDAGGCFQAA